MARIDIGVVIVTYNRCRVLSECLRLFSEMPRKADVVVVVNNNSGDGTATLLSDWKSRGEGMLKIVVSMERNTGGSGGFRAGLEEMQRHKVDWVWVSDDDAFPAPDVFEKFEEGLAGLRERTQDCISAVCCTVRNHGKIDTMHRRRVGFSRCRFIETPVPESEYASPYFEIDQFSYVGTLLNAASLREAGLIDPGFFICYDDTEHSMRMRKVGRMFCLPSMLVSHDTDSDPGGALASWKTYYSFRNKLVMIKRNYGYPSAMIAVFEVFVKALVGGRTARNRWIDVRLKAEAIRDAMAGRLGVHPIYAPGWTPEPPRPPKGEPLFGETLGDPSPMKNFTLLFDNEPFEAVHFGKDVGLFPWYMNYLYGYKVTIVFFRSEYNRGVTARTKPGAIGIKKLQRLFGFLPDRYCLSYLRNIAMFRYIIKNARAIDYLMLFHVKRINKTYIGFINCATPRGRCAQARYR